MSYDKRLDLGGFFLATVTVTNTSNRTVNGFTARWAWIGAQHVVLGVGASVKQTAEWVEAKDGGRLRPGQSTTFVVIGRTDFGANWTPVVRT